jgi:hypothetical protein
VATGDLPPAACGGSLVDGEASPAFATTSRYIGRFRARATPPDVVEGDHLLHRAEKTSHLLQERIAFAVMVVWVAFMHFLGAESHPPTNEIQT